MGEEVQKRNTDCVYFLASPLTCKKGSDCEYRHSEAARVNPRDCWYWLSGNCLNANCAFRHPPLDGRPGAGTSASTGGSAAATASGIVASSSSAVQLPPSSSKSAVPCFFFSQGFCSKGSKCVFLHGPPPTSFRKEAMTYRKPSEQPAAAAGNGLVSAKAQVQESKQPSLIHSPTRAAGFTPSNVYKLSIHGGGPSGSSAPSGKQPTEKTDQSAKVKLLHRGVEISRRNQPVGGRVPQVQVRDESLEHVPPAERAAPKSQPLQLDLSRGLHRQGRPSSAIHNSRTIEGFVSSELQEWASEEEAHHLNCGLDARDLRNHLKRKRNESAFASRNFNGREHPKDRLESGRLASRAVLVRDVKDLVASSSSKRVTQDKDASTFTGPKSLAQIKAEKSKAVDAHENSGGLARSSDDDLVAEVKKEQSPPELCDNSTLKVCENGKQNRVDKLIVKEHETLEVVVRNKEDSGPFRESKGYGKIPVTPSSSELVPDKAVREVGSWKQRDEKLTANVVGSKVVSDSGMYFHHSMDTSEGNGTEVGYYISADDLMEDDGAEASENPVDADYLSDYEEDDFAKKLSSFA